MKWAGLGLAIYAGYRAVATGLGTLGPKIVDGIEHCGVGLLGVGHVIALPYVFIPGLILGTIIGFDYYCGDLAMLNKMKSGWKSLWGAS